MKSKGVVVFTFVLALALTTILFPTAGSTVQARDNCQPFHMFVQLSLPTPNQFATTDTWGGPVFGNIGSQFLQGGISGNDGTEYPHGPISIFKDGIYKVCLTSAPSWGGASDCLDSFTYKAQAVVVWPAGDSLGTYKATVRIISGTNRFASASGRLELDGPFIAWADSNSAFGVSGRGNLEFTGNICGVQ